MEPGEVEAAVRSLEPGRWVVAVSGGRDSMVLLHALLAHRSDAVVAVATFDHATGPASGAAVEAVRAYCASAGVPCGTGRAPAGTPATETAWRDARWRFLRRCATEAGAGVLTAHTRDDQVETILLRLLRQAGPWGLGGMRAVGVDGGGLMVARPLLGVSRAAVAAYATRHRVSHVEDPSNASPRFLRNRVRHEILPALERVHPGFAAWCLGLGERAARWRAELEALVAALGVTVPRPGTAVVPVAAVDGLTAAGWQPLWPAIAARAGVVLDRRGVARAARWAPAARAGQRIPLSGGHLVERTARTFVVRRAPSEGTTGAPDGYIDQ